MVSKFNNNNIMQNRLSNPTIRQRKDYYKTVFKNNIQKYAVYKAYTLHQKHKQLDDGLGCFYIMESVSNVVMNTEVHVSFQISAFVFFQFSSVQSLSRVRLCDLMNHSTPGLPVHHQLPEFIQTHTHRVGDAIQPSHPLSSLSPLVLNPSQHQSLF